METTPAIVPSYQFVSATADERTLLQTLLKLASPQTARYVGHAVRRDNTYRVVVHTTDGFRILSIPAPVLALVAEGILVEQDRAFVVGQLS